MEDFVTYEQALALKKLGFLEDCFYFYELCEKPIPNHYDSGDERVFVNKFLDSKNEKYPGIKEICDAPTLPQVQKWFIKKYNIKIIPNYVKNNFYTCKMYWVDSQGFEQFTQCEEKPYVYNLESYENALSIGISTAINYLMS